MIPEAGTSVAPRQRPTVQRPKGNAQPSQLPLVAPPSPSPRNNLSPVPPPSQVDMSASDQFTAHFQANFPSTTAAGSNVQPHQLISKPSNLSITNAVTQSFDDNSDNLFESQFPDPFREVASTITTKDTCNIQNEQMDANNSETGNVVSPTKPPAQLLLETPKIGHRRNMSDTSAFSKYINQI